MNAQEIADRLTITDKIYRYCRAVDRLDEPLGYSVFHADSCAEIGVYKGTGHGWIDFICRQHRKYLHHSHQVTNVLINLHGDRAGSEAYVTATLRSVDGGRVVQRQFWARYVDDWICCNDDWVITKRECVIDFDSSAEVSPLNDNRRAQRDRSDPSYSVLS